ncbi:MAG: metal-dependent hydrolase [Patescibacteria group bacterium]|nr:metal-dependent hydrolase [Patescibacteria group bacterium]
MPLTPLHLGPGLLLGVFTLKFFNLWALLLGSVVMDIEPIVLLIINPCYSCPHHGFFHSILGALFGSLIIAAILWKFRKKLNQISLRYKIRQSFSFPVLFFSSLVASLIHIFFDSLTHFDVFPFWPLKYQPTLIDKEVYWSLNLILLTFGIIGLILIRHKLKK